MSAMRLRSWRVSMRKYRIKALYRAADHSIPDLLADFSVIIDLTANNEAHAQKRVVDTLSVLGPVALNEIIEI